MLSKYLLGKAFLPVRRSFSGSSSNVALFHGLGRKKNSLLDPASQTQPVQTLNGLIRGDKSMVLCVCVRRVQSLLSQRDEESMRSGNIEPFALQIALLNSTCLPVKIPPDLLSVFSNNISHQQSSALREQLPLNIKAPCSVFGVGTRAQEPQVPSDVSLFLLFFLPCVV